MLLARHAQALARRTGPLVLACGLSALTMSFRAAAQSPFGPPKDASGQVPPLGTYVHLLGTVSLGDSLRFNNPFRLARPLGDSAESVSLTPVYGNLGGALLLGAPDGFQHGLSVQWSRSLAGLPQHVVTPAYMLLYNRARPWVGFGRLGLPIILNPDPGLGTELGLGGAYYVTAGLALQAELIGNIFYGAATWDREMTTIPMLSMQAGLLVDWERLP